jgi:hypothetical protein
LVKYYITLYQSHTSNYPLPSWLYENLEYFESFFSKSKVNTNLIDEWNKLDTYQKREMLSGASKMNSNELFDLWFFYERIGYDDKYKPFFGNIGYCHIRKSKYFDIDVTKLIDPFTKNSEHIRYSLSYITGSAFLISNGPDGDIDIDEKVIFGVNLNEDYKAPDYNSIYDPTNGILSNGDIFIIIEKDQIDYKNIPAFRNISIEEL